MDVAKTLVPIASAAVIFSVAFAGSFAKPSIHVGWRLCLVVSWICFLCALTSSLLSLWFAIGLHDSQANILEQSDKLRTAIAKPNVSADEMLVVMNDVFVAANKPIEQRDWASRRLLNAAYVFYGLAIFGRCSWCSPADFSRSAIDSGDPYFSNNPRNWSLMTASLGDLAPPSNHWRTLLGVTE